MTDEISFLSRPDELLIKVCAAAINPVDIQLWGNHFVGGVLSKKEKRTGRDYSRTIVGVGSELGRDQYINFTDKDPICKKPTCWTHEEGAAVPLVAMTAFACLHWSPAEKKEGGMRRAVDAGTSSGVGIWCVQLAKKLFNCHVIGICSGGNADFFRLRAAPPLGSLYSIVGDKTSRMAMGGSATYFTFGVVVQEVVKGVLDDGSESWKRGLI
ncbi:hypothetical protein K469DRAFT_723262 [Zopfia rhizophila CBS 207.26]|uniref:GroES-like protein n=1 Tax=Zopfia rhizophila CBS 207.26 TaxID=1314779 RepID=A0A6A6DAB5_9PEZI|nr:hypothetical protein K469DRAFT_723262 [Zopfia rhizophila CBS 207.26]